MNKCEELKSASPIRLSIQRMWGLDVFSFIKKIYTKKGFLTVKNYLSQCRKKIIGAPFSVPKIVVYEYFWYSGRRITNFIGKNFVSQCRRIWVFSIFFLHWLHLLVLQLAFLQQLFVVIDYFFSLALRMRHEKLRRADTSVL